MTWAITCSLASSQGIRLPLRQISSLALMAIDALLELVSNGCVRQRLPGHRWDAGNANHQRRGETMKDVRHCGLSLTGHYTRGRTTPLELDFHGQGGAGKKKICRQLTLQICRSLPPNCSWLLATPIEP